MQKMTKKDLMIFTILWLFAIMLTLMGCAKNTSGIPCEALEVIYYENIEPLEAEIEVLKNNAVIEEVCK